MMEIFPKLIQVDIKRQTQEALWSPGRINKNKSVKNNTVEPKTNGFHRPERICLLGFTLVTQQKFPMMKEKPLTQIGGHHLASYPPTESLPLGRLSLGLHLGAAVPGPDTNTEANSKMP